MIRLVIIYSPKNANMNNYALSGVAGYTIIYDTKTAIMPVYKAVSLP